MLRELLTTEPKARTIHVLHALEVPVSTWYREATAQRKRPGPAAQPIPAEIEAVVVQMATANPWYGYKRIAVMCRRAGDAVKNRQAYRVNRKTSSGGQIVRRVLLTTNASTCSATRHNGGHAVQIHE